MLVAAEPNVPYAGPFLNGTCTYIGEITQYYVRGLGRNPDYGGISYYLGLPTINAAATILQSQEFYLYNWYNDWKVQSAYLALFRRLPDSGGMSYWLWQLNSGVPWANVLNALLYSAEYQNRLPVVGTGYWQLYSEAYLVNLGMDFEYYWALRSNLRHELWRTGRDPLNWSSDGCSVVSDAAVTFVDVRTCRRHDFGWRNFGKGLTLWRTNDMKHRVNEQFLLDMVDLCHKQWTGLWHVSCDFEAMTMYNFVQVAPW